MLKVVNIEFLKQTNALLVNVGLENRQRVHLQVTEHLRTLIHKDVHHYRYEIGNEDLRPWLEGLETDGSPETTSSHKAPLGDGYCQEYTSVKQIIVRETI